jgi:hypothetical protein
MIFYRFNSTFYRLFVAQEYGMDGTGCRSCPIRREYPGLYANHLASA